MDKKWWILFGVLVVVVVFGIIYFFTYSAECVVDSQCVVVEDCCGRHYCAGASPDATRGIVACPTFCPPDKEYEEISCGCDNYNCVAE